MTIQNLYSQNESYNEIEIKLNRFVKNNKTASQQTNSSWNNVSKPIQIEIIISKKSSTFKLEINFNESKIEKSVEIVTNFSTFKITHIFNSKILSFKYYSFVSFHCIFCAPHREKRVEVVSSEIYFRKIQSTFRYLNKKNYQDFFYGNSFLHQSWKFVSTNFLNTTNLFFVSLVHFSKTKNGTYAYYCASVICAPIMPSLMAGISNYLLRLCCMCADEVIDTTFETHVSFWCDILTGNRQ